MMINIIQPSEPRDISYSTEFLIGNTSFNIFISLANELETTSNNHNAPSKIYHNHFYHELIMSPTADFQGFTNNQSFWVPKNNIVLFQSGITHTTTLTTIHSPINLGITFKRIKQSASAEQTFNIFNQIFSKEYQILNKKNLIDSLNQVIQNILSPTLFSYYSIPALLQLFLINLAELYVPIQPQLTAFGPLDYRISVELNNMRFDATLKETAEKLFISARQLERRVYQLYGKSFRQRRTEIRMENAKKLLLSTNLSIEKIADNLDYDSSSSFIAAFKRFVGLTPTQYRSKNTDDY